jgi:hypothetical protein
VLDGEARTIEWACAGHPGAVLVGPVAFDLDRFPQGSGKLARPTTFGLTGRGRRALPVDALVVIASTAVREPEPERWETVLHEHAPAGPRLANVLLDYAAKRGRRDEDLLAVVVRRR